jgi:twinkle protein
MVRLFGAARFKFIDWPEGAKDANDLLRADGAEALREYVEQSARPWPVAGLYRLSEIPEPAPVRTWSTGFRLWDEHVRLAPGMFSVLTGYPSHGKTTWCAQLWSQIVRQYDLVACVASFETRAKPHLRRHLRTAYHRRLERELSAEERAEADRWIDEHYVFLVHPDQRPTLEWFLDVSEVAVVRHGASVVLLDPWNRLEGARERGEHEVDYIQRCLRALHSFALDMRVHVQVVAHPSKMDSTRRGKAPELEDISGPRAWDSMPDQGFCVHRPKLFDGLERRTEAHFYHLKARMDELGYPCRLDIRYEPTTGMFYPEMAPAAQQAQRDMGLGLGDVSDLGRNI